MTDVIPDRLEAQVQFLGDLARRPSVLQHARGSRPGADAQFISRAQTGIGRCRFGNSRAVRRQGTPGR
jgi:hypothetical protein